MRPIATLLAGICLSAAYGQGFPGAKPDLVNSAAPNGGSGLGALFNVLLALGIVYGLLRYAMPKVMARLNKRLVTGTGSAIRIEESASFAGGSLYVVSARGKSMLLSVGAQGVRCLADLTEAPKASEPQSFGDFVERELISTSEKRQSINENVRWAPSADPEWTAALARLERLSK